MLLLNTCKTIGWTHDHYMFQLCTTELLKLRQAVILVYAFLFKVVRVAYAYWQAWECISWSGPIERKPSAYNVMTNLSPGFILAVQNC